MNSITFQCIGIAALFAIIILSTACVLLNIWCWKRLVIVRNSFTHTKTTGNLFVRISVQNNVVDEFNPSYVLRVCSYYLFLLPKNMKGEEEILVYQGKSVTYKSASQIVKTTEVIFCWDNTPEGGRKHDSEIVLIQSDLYTTCSKGLDVISTRSYDKTKLLKSYDTFSSSCLVCLEGFVNDEEMFLLNCHHSFHKQCIVSCFLNNHMICPACNSDVGATLIRIEHNENEIRTDRFNYGAMTTVSALDM